MPKDNQVKKEKKHFFKNFKAELKKVIWPTPKQLVNNTVAVITIVLITTIIVFALDLVFEKLNTASVNKLKEIKDSMNTSVENTEGTENTENVENTEEVNNEVEQNGEVEENTEPESTETVE